jgi:hypothetical protein
MNHMDIFNELVKDNNYPDSLKIDTADTCLKILPLIHKAFLYL